MGWVSPSHLTKIYEEVLLMERRVIIIDLNKNKGQVAFVAGRRKQEVTEYDKREWGWGMSVFYRETKELEFKFVLNFVLSDDEIEVLGLPLKVKSIDDLNYILLASNWTMRIFKNHLAYTGKKSDIVEEINIEEPAGYSAMSVMSEIKLTSENENAFTSGLELAMAFPFEGSNVYYKIPNHIPEEEVVL